MAGKVVVSTLNNDTGVLATQNGMTGIAKAWVYFDGTGTVAGTPFNISSVTKNSTGVYTVNFTTALTTNYAVSALSGNSNNSNAMYQASTHTSTSVVVTCQVGTSAAPQDTNMSVIVFAQ